MPSFFEGIFVLKYCNKHKNIFTLQANSNRSIGKNSLNSILFISLLIIKTYDRTNKRWLCKS